MKLIKLSILIVILSIGSYTYSQVPLKPLYELFTSSTCDPCVEANEILTEILEANPDEYALIKYQMDWPGSGDIYYTEEGGVRKGYYGVNSVPDLYINAEQLDPDSSISQEIFEEYANMQTSMEIEITQAFIDEENVISIDAEIMPLTDYGAGLKAHIVVVEKMTYNNIGTNGETEFSNVMMKMLPNASGTELETLTTGNLTTLSETFDMDETNMETANDLAVIVFIQDNSDKSIVQSAMLDVDGVFESYNITYIVEDVNANPIEGAEVLLENYGTRTSDESGQVDFESVLVETYNISINYAGLIPHENTINVIDEDITQVVVLEHYTSLLETFNSGIPSSWTKHVGDNNYLFYYSGIVKFARFSGDDDPIMLISPAIEVHPTDTLSFEFGDAENNPTMTFGILSDPYDPSTFIELGVHYPGDEWESYKLPMNSISTSDTVMYFAWNHIYPNESSFHLDNVFLKKEGETCVPIYSIGCSNFGIGFTDFALEQIENYGSECDELNGKGWSQYLELGPAELFAGESYTINMATGNENIYATVWVDFNDDFVFTADEKVVDNFLMEQPGILYEVELMIPAEAVDGLHLMRARTNAYDLCNDPCEEYYYGEAEDYLIQIGEELILPPTNLNYELAGSNINLEWDAPISEELIGYNIYYSHESSDFELLANVAETSFTHESPEYGLYLYYVTALYYTGESDPTNTVEVLITGMQSQYDNDFLIYPNPASDMVNLKSNFDITSIKVYNHSVQVVLEKTIQNKNYQFNVSKFIPGLYFFQIETNEGTYNQRIIIQ